MCLSIFWGNSLLYWIGAFIGSDHGKGGSNRQFIRQAPLLEPQVAGMK